MIPILLVFSDWGILILRVFLGGILIRRGFPKIKNLKTFRTGGKIFALSEFFGGLMMLFGFLTQIAAFLLAIQFLIFAFKTRGKSERTNEDEFNWLILASLILFVVLGSGMYGVDRFFRFLIY